jgi:DNA modification methylase
MVKTNDFMKEKLDFNEWQKQEEEVISIKNLKPITSFIFSSGFKLLPNVTELFELEFAYYEHKFLSKKEIIQRGAFFKSVNDIPTNHYIICSNNSPVIWEGRSEITKSYFKEGNFSTGYATHGLFPYRGKFHPQLIKGILNILKVKQGEVVLDPMCGSGTLNIEASLIGIDSIGIEKSPFCILMSKVKYEGLKVDGSTLASINNEKDKDLKYYKTIKIFLKGFFLVLQCQHIR